MAKHYRTYQWLVAAYLTLLFSFSGLAQVAVRAPASATPGNAAVFGASPNLIIDGGALAAGNGIATNNGAGNQNTFTNATIVTPSNFLATVVWTNDNNNNFNSKDSVEQEFTGVSTTNNAQILWIGPLGLFGNLGVIPQHDGSGSPSGSELVMESSGKIAIIPNNVPGNNAVVGNIQLGGAGTAGGAFLNMASNYTVFPFVSPSQPLWFRSAMDSNNVSFVWDPGMVADWPKGSNSYEAHFKIFHDAGQFDQSLNQPSVNQALVGIDMYGGTNGSTLYTGMELFGRLGTTTNTFRFDTNGATMTCTNFTFGGNGVNPDFVYQQSSFSMVIGGQDPSLNFQISADGSTGATHGFYGGGNFGGFGISKGGLFISSGIGGGPVPTNGLLFEVTGNSYIPSNAAPYVVISNNFPIVNGNWTNNFGVRVFVEFDIRCIEDNIAGTGQAEYLYTPVINGVSKNLANLQKGLISGTGTFTNIAVFTEKDVYGPGDYFSFSTTTAGTGSGVFPTNFSWTAQ